MDPKHILRNYQGSNKDFVVYQGLLEEAHEQGLSEIKQTILQLPSKDNGDMAIVQVTVTTSKGNFTEVGCASPENTAGPVRKHLLHMAATRAKARAMRDAVNIGMTSLEELGGDDEPVPVTGDYESVKNAVNRIAKQRKIERAALIGELRTKCDFTGQVSEQTPEKLEEIADYLNDNY